MKCDCGNICVRRLYAIKTQKYCTKCKPKLKNSSHYSWMGCGDISHDLFTTYKHSANAKNFEFDVSIDYLWDLFLKQNRKCAFTGELLYFNDTYRRKSNRTASLDRIDSNLGYIVNNLQWVHRDVNKLKKNFDDARFIQICLNISNHINKQTSNNMTIVEKINAELQAFNAKKQELVESLRKDFPALLAPLFEKSKLINSIGWTQYTPYFSDGDECVFGVNNDEPYVNGHRVYDDELDFLDEQIGPYNDRRPNPTYNAEESAIYDDFCSLLHSIPDEFYRDLFGDHALITIHRDGRIEVEEYDHD